MLGKQHVFVTKNDNYKDNYNNAYCILASRPMADNILFIINTLCKYVICHLLELFKIMWILIGCQRF